MSWVACGINVGICIQQPKVAQLGNTRMKGRQRPTNYDRKRLKGTVKDRSLFHSTVTPLLSRNMCDGISIYHQMYLIRSCS